MKDWAILSPIRAKVSSLADLKNQIEQGGIFSVLDKNAEYIVTVDRDGKKLLYRVQMFDLEEGEGLFSRPRWVSEWFETRSPSKLIEHVNKIVMQTRL